MGTFIPHHQLCQLQYSSTCFNVLLFSLLLLPSCNMRTSNDQQGNQGNDTIPSGNSVSDKISNFFLDTSRLNEMEILYSLDAYDHTGTLIVQDAKIRRKQILGITYFILATPSARSNDPLFKLDSISIRLPQHEQIISLVEWGPYLHSYEELRHAGLTFDDYNFDGITDVSIASSASGVSNDVRDYYLYNKQSKLFDHHIRLANAGFDREKKLVITRWFGGHAGKIGGTTYSKFSKQDILIFIKSENQDFNPGLDAYIKETKTLNSDGGYSIRMDTIKRE